MKFLDMFTEIVKGDFGLTDEAIYKSLQSTGKLIPVWGGNKSHEIRERMVSENAKTKYGAAITVFSGTGIVISLDGSAGSMTYKTGECFALNHHAGFFTVKADAVNKINLEYFALFCAHELSSVSVSDGSKTLSLEQIYKMDFDIPPIDAQNRIMSLIMPLNNKKKKCQLALSLISKLYDKVLSTSYFAYQAKQLPIRRILDYLSGNSGLTEELVYQNLNLDGLKYDVLSGAVDNQSRMGVIPMCSISGKKIRVFKNKEGLLVIRKGKAGNVRFLKKGNYTINDDAYILFVRDDCPYKVNLKWVSIQYRQEFLSYASGSSNGTWNMTGFFKSVSIDIPSIEEQNKIVEDWIKIEQYENDLKKILAEIDKLFTKSISIVEQA